MMRHSIEIKMKEYLKPIARILLLNQGSSLKDVIVLIASRLNIPIKTVQSFVKSFYRKGFLLISRDKYVFTIEGNLYLLSVLGSDLEKRGAENDGK
jgi:Mn-dependent DtxR family transcriptional regulator